MCCFGSSLVNALNPSQQIETSSRLLCIMFVVLLHSSLMTTLAVLNMLSGGGPVEEELGQSAEDVAKHADATAINRGMNYKLPRMLEKIAKPPVGIFVVTKVFTHNV